MSKLGRYSADRKKIQNLSATYTASVADCGTIFTLSTAAGPYSVTLPSVASAGKGWWCKLVLIDTTNDKDIVVSGSSSDKTEAAGTISGKIFMNNVSMTGSILGAQTHTNHDTGLGPVLTGSQAFKFDISANAVNDQVELVCDGTNWYGLSVTSGTLGVIGAQG